MALEKGGREEVRGVGMQVTARYGEREREGKASGLEPRV